MIKALKDEGYEKADEEYRDFLKFLRNEMIKDPSDMMALNFRVMWILVNLARLKNFVSCCRTILLNRLKNKLMRHDPEVMCNGSLALGRSCC